MPESITLYAFGDNDRSGKVRWTARELGLEIEEVALRPGDHRKPPYTDLGVLAKKLPPDGHLCGERFSVADVVCGYSLRLALQCGLVERAAVDPYFSRLVARPAAQRSRIFASLGA